MKNLRTGARKNIAATEGLGTDQDFEVMALKRHSFVACLVGEASLVYNSMSEKHKRQVLLPPPPKNRAERTQTLKHDPIQEYRDSVYTIDDGPTLLCFDSVGFKKAMATAALYIPGAAKTDIGRLLSVTGTHVSIFGVPQLYMAVVRQAGMTRAPDIRTRAILPRWACAVRIEYPEPLMRTQHLINLLGAAGIICGIGDGRQEKGTHSFGRWRVVDQDDPEFQEICKTGGRDAQTKALYAENPACYDNETRKLLRWSIDEIDRRKSRSQDEPVTRKPRKPAEIEPVIAAASSRRGPGRRPRLNGD